MKRLLKSWPPALAWSLWLVLGLYFLGVMIALPWFTVRDVRVEGFRAWILGGELRTVGACLSWPVHVFRTSLHGRGERDEIDFILVDDAAPVQSSALPFKPMRYPRLLECLREKKSFSLSYRTESGKVDVIDVGLNGGDGLVVRRDTYYRAGPSGGGRSGEDGALGTLVEASVTMMDRDQNTSLDFVKIKAKNWGRYRFRPLKIEHPEDEQLKAFWNATLEILYNQGDCFVP